jgi:predicted nucleic acid-binding protein
VIEAPEVDLHTPALCDVEVCSGLRRAIRAGPLSVPRAEEALRSYIDLPLTLYGHRWLLNRILALRDNFSAYDAAHVALAERLDAELLTGDGGFARAIREHLAIDVLSVGS